jgi:hypothetical protein
MMTSILMGITITKRTCSRAARTHLRAEDKQAK